MAEENWQLLRRWKTTWMSLTHLFLYHWHSSLTKWIHSPGDWTTAIFNILAHKASTLDQRQHIPQAERTTRQFRRRYRCNHYYERTRPLKLECQVFMHTLRNPPYITPPTATDSCNSLSVTVLVPLRAALNTFPVTRCRYMAVTWRLPAVLNELYFSSPLMGFLAEPV
jgi:hypothetical protein